MFPFPQEAPCPPQRPERFLCKEGGPGGRVWEAPPPHTTWPPPTSTYGLGGGERQQTAKPSQTGVGFHGNQGARRKGGTPDPAVPLSALPRPQSLSQGPPKTLHPLLSALGASWACHEHSLPCAQGMSVTWVLPGQDRQPKKESSVQVHPHQQSHEAPSVLCALGPRVSGRTPRGSQNQRVYQSHPRKDQRRRRLRPFGHR